MGKKKKTLKDKKLAELRRLTEAHGKTSQLQDIKTPDVPTPSFVYTFSKQQKPIGYAHIYSLQHDLRKTLFVSLGILLFLLLFSALLHSHAFMLPLVSLRY